MEEPEHSSTFPLRPPTEDDESASKPARDRGGSCKRVTMASVSRYLTDRRYLVRRPLVSAQHTSILKKMETEEDVSRSEGNQKHTGASSLTPIELTLESFNHSHSDISSFSEDLGSPVGVLELRTNVLHKPRTYESPLLGRTSPQQSFSSSILEVQRLNTPLRPPLTSTVLYPSYTPRSGYSRTGLTGSGGHNKSCFPGNPSKGHPLSVHQRNYWACAIPKTSPPTADRCSRNWDPNQEYQSLLDYTYPLRPERELIEWKSSHLVTTKSNLQDSGIEVDHLCSSNSLTGLGFSGSETEQTRERSTVREGQRPLDQQVFTDSSEGFLSRIQLSQINSLSLSLDNLQIRGSTPDSRHRQRRSPPSRPAFIRSTSVLPCCRDAGGEVDDEFWHLPLELEELKLLSRQVREVTTQLGQPGLNSSWGSLGPDTSIHSSISVPVSHEAEGRGNSETGRKETSHLSQIDHRASETLRRSFGELVEPDGERSDEACVQYVNVPAEQPYVLKSPSSQWSGQEDGKQRDSLLQHIQMFCSQLEQLIQQLYSLSEKMELLTTASTGSVESTLAEQQCFQGEVSCRQPLASSVLHTGRRLLNCINATSPFLRDTLLMIEKHSGPVGQQEPGHEHIIVDVPTSLCFQPSWTAPHS